ncbi:MAG: FAD-dependent oxidoreductase [Bosea sp.]|nr:FAD-dependent oxidoreductase [Bosea sp. (in: a-proteobacteria)]
MLDLVIIGAGPAGIAAARCAMERGLTVRIIEARGRVGGRVVTRHLAGHAVDLGAHWLHAGPINPVVALARRERIALRAAPQESHLFINGKSQPQSARIAYGAAFARAEGALAAAADSLGPDEPAAAVLPFLGPWRRPVAAITGLVCGRPLQVISARDFASAEYAHNHFAPGGFGALLARLSRGLPVSLGMAAQVIDWSGAGVRVSTKGGVIEARKALCTAPPMVLRSGAIAYDPPLPEAVLAAIHGFRAGVYEHAVIRWPSAPWRGADRIATLTGRRLDGAGLLTRLDGSPLHYLEFDEPMARALRQPHRLRAGLAVRALLAEQFGARAIRDLAVLHVSDWLADPLSLSSWSSVPPGQAAIRDALARPLGGRLAFAGEMTDHAQWGTVGGAWAAGEQAVDALFRAGA